MKCISLHQPWATLIADGHKRFETRSWNTKHRGPILIHAAKATDRIAASSFPFTEVIKDPDKLPAGAIVAKATLVVVYSTNEILKNSYFKKEKGYYELYFGDYHPDRYAWLLKDIVPFRLPLPYKGQQGIWNVPIHTFTDMEAENYGQQCIMADSSPEDQDTANVVFLQTGAPGVVSKNGLKEID